MPADANIVERISPLFMVVEDCISIRSTQPVYEKSEYIENVTTQLCEYFFLLLLIIRLSHIILCSKCL